MELMMMAMQNQPGGMGGMPGGMPGGMGF